MTNFKQYYTEAQNDAWKEFRSGTATFTQYGHAIWDNRKQGKPYSYGDESRTGTPVGRTEKDIFDNDQDWKTDARLFTDEELKKFLGNKLYQEWEDDLGEEGLGDIVHLSDVNGGIWTVETMLYEGKSVPLYSQEILYKGETVTRSWIEILSRYDDRKVWYTRPEIDRFITISSTSAVKSGLKRL